MYEDPLKNYEQMNRLKKLNSGRRRKELRVLCNNRMYRIQADADAGRIGGAIRLIMNKKKGYRMECLIDGDVCHTDPDKVDVEARDHFRKWFERTELEIEEGEEMDRIIRGGEKEKFLNKLRTMGMDEKASEVLWEGMGKKDICEEGKAEGEALTDYVPTFEEFEEIINKMNPHSTGGISGLTYHMVQRWETRVKKKLYEELKDCWVKRVVPEGWGDSMLAPIPKVVDPTIDELRPLMLYEVLRKIWTGLIMGKLRDYWRKYGLIDDNQHGFMGGKGTHTAIPIIINCMEAAKDFATDLYISSWDIKRAFDSLGPEYVIRSLQRLHIPRDIAEYLVNMDDTGQVYVRTPLNAKLRNEGRLNEGRGFKRGKGVGQGDVPSPMLWVEAFDSLLTALGKVESGFKTQDIDGKTRMVKDVAFADDLISVAGTLVGLQKKADIMSAWCGVSGVEIAAKKFRTFWKEWGVKKGGGDRKIVIVMKGKVRKEVDVKDDGLMTHLGIIRNMDMKTSGLFSGIGQLRMIKEFQNV